MAVKKYYVTVDEAGTIWWYKDAKCKILHRENGPAVESADGDKFWWQNGRRHRTDGPAIEWCNSTKEWYQDGLRHRTDGPAVEYATGDKRWYQNGDLHRTNGPAIEYASGTKRWYINGDHVTEAEFLAATQPVVEMTVADVEKLLGKRVKIIK